MKCTNCGSENVTGAKFCNNCGAKLDEINVTSKNETVVPKNEVVDNKNKTIMYAIIVIVIMIIGAVMFNNNTQKNTPPPAQTTQTTSTKEKDKPVPVPAPVPKKENPAPVKIEKVTIKKDMIGQPNLYLVIRNISQKKIDAYKIVVECRNNYNEKLKQFGFGDTYFKGIGQETINPNELNERGAYWTLNGFDTATRFHIRVFSIHFADGTEWRPDDDNVVEFDLKTK